MNILSQFSELTLDLYRATGYIEQDNFRKWAFDQLRSFIKFDSAIWIQATIIDDLPVTQNIYLHNQPESMLNEYAQWSSDDVVLEAILCNPGRCFLWRDIEDFDERHKTQMYKQFESKYGLEDGISIMIPFCGSGIHSFLSLYRSQRTNPFTIDDCDRFQAITPHLVEAEISVLAREIRINHDIDKKDHSVAVVSTEGYLKMAEIKFIDCLITGWPNWNPPQIPIDILNTLDHSNEISCILYDYFIKSIPNADGFVLSIRPTHPLDYLSSREQQVAVRIADGMPYKTVATELDISLSTVKNHVYSVHSKLRVTSSAELRKKLSK